MANLGKIIIVPHDKTYKQGLVVPRFVMQALRYTTPSVALPADTNRFASAFFYEGFTYRRKFTDLCSQALAVLAINI